MKKKRMAAIALAIAGVMALTGCGLGSTTSTTEATGSTEVKETTSAATDSSTEATADTTEEEEITALSTQGKTNDIVIKVSNGSGDTAPFVKEQILTFAPEVEEKTGGKVGVEVYSNGQLGADADATEAVIAGQLECCNTSTGPLVSYVPELAIFDIPFLFDSAEEADYVLDNTEVGEYINKKLEEKGIINLAWNENGFRELTNSQREVACAADVKGLKIRTMENEFHQALWNSLGATAVPMSASELYTALQQGTVDGEENPIPNMYGYRFQEVQPYISMTNHIYSPFIMAFSKEIWDTYDADTQAALKEAAADYAAAERARNREEAETDLQKCIDENGCTVTYITDEDLAEFKELTAGVRDQIREKAGDEIMDLLDSAIAEYEAQK